MSPETIGEWLAANPCGCEERGGRLFQCSFHEGFAAGLRAGEDTRAAERAVIAASLAMYEATKRTAVFGSQDGLHAAEKVWGESVRVLLASTAKCSKCDGEGMLNMPAWYDPTCPVCGGSGVAA